MRPSRITVSSVSERPGGIDGDAAAISVSIDAWTSATPTETVRTAPMNTGQRPRNVLYNILSYVFVNIEADRNLRNCAFSNAVDCVECNMRLGL